MSWDLIREVGLLRFVIRFARRQIEKRLFGTGHRLTLPTGAAFYAPPWSRAGSEVIYTGCRVDWGADRLLLEYLDPQGTFLDVGANIGYYTALAAPSVKRVVAFEPDRRNLPVLETNLSALANADAVATAVSSQTGVLGFRLGETTETSRLMAAEGATETVETIALDRWKDENPGDRVTAIKIDVEGFEIAVLEGARRLIECEAPLILSEFNLGDDAANEIPRLAEFTDSLDYRIFGFLRTRPGKREFRRFTPDDLAGGRYKMLFLCPPRLEESFTARTR